MTSGRSRPVRIKAPAFRSRRTGPITLRGTPMDGFARACSMPRRGTAERPFPIRFRSARPIADHRPFVLAGSHGVTMVWKEFDGEKTVVNLMISHDDGRSWSKPRTIASTTDASDHPLLISDGRKTYLSWMTKADGFRFQPIE